MDKNQSRAERSRPVYFSDEFKREVIEEYLRGGSCKREVQRKYGIKRHSAIHEWMQFFGYTAIEEKGLNLALLKQLELAKKDLSTSAQTVELVAKVRLLEKQLEEERLRSELYSRMIDLAEKTYKITVRKNSNTK
jgi:transposase-like protein